MVIGSSPLHARPRPERRGKVVSLAYFSSDDELVSGLRAGRTDAQAEIFRRFELRVATLLHRLTGSHHQVPDLVEEVFARAFAEAKSLRGSSGVLEPWLVRVTVTCARSFLWRRSFLRRLGRWRPRRLWAGAWRSERRYLPAVAGSANTAQFDAVASFYTHVDRLPLSQRLCVLLDLVDGMCVPEIAEACSSSTGQVRRRLQKAKARLQPLLQGDARLRCLGGGDG